MSVDLEDEDRERRLDEAAAQYLRLRASGQPFDRQQWLAAQYPDLEAELSEFVSDLSRLPHVSLQLRADPSAEVGKPPTSLDATLGSDSIGVRYSTLNSESERWESDPAALDLSKATSRYRLQTPLGVGGMGEVWLAEDSVVGRQIAVKKIRKAGPEVNPAIEARFLFESQVMGRLEHPCIVPLHDFGRDDAGDLFSVMKLVHGQSLKQRLSEFHKSKREDWPHSVEFQRLVEVFARICQAVAYAHSRGILHRDIKPDNIMLGSYSEVMLLDWGLAKAIDQPETHVQVRQDAIPIRPLSGSSSETRAGAVIGSPVYMAPEVAAGQSASVDQRTDIYLLGATLYELLTGRPPRSGSSVLEMVEIAQHRMPAAPRSIDRRIPKPLEAICLRAMALDRDQRYAKATDLARDLERYIAGEPVSAYPEPLHQRAWRWCRRHRRGLSRMLVGVTLLAAIVLAIVSSQHARMLDQRELARRQLMEFRRLTDEVQFFAANSDPVTEQTPYYDPQQALHLSDQAMTFADRWGRDGQDGQGLPLLDERNAYLHELHTLLLVSANLQQQSSLTSESQWKAIRLLDRAAALPRGESRGYHVIRERCLRSLERNAEADQERKLAEDVKSMRTSLDWFLEGESFRQQSSRVSPTMRSIDRDARLPLDSVALGEAMAAYQKAIQLDPLNYWARYQLARCYLRTQRGPEAIEALGGCIALRPGSPWAYSTRGLARGLMGEFELAEEDLERALQVSPGFRPAHLNRGLVAFLDGRDQDAMNELDLALAPPSDSELIEAAFYRAQVHLRREDLAAAQRDCDRFLKARPNFPPALLLDARIRFQQGDHENGMKSVSTLVRLNSGPTSNLNDQDMRVGRGKVLRRLAVSFDPATQRRVLELALKEYETVEEPLRAAEVTAIKDLLGLSQEVIDQYSERLATNPRDIAVRNMRGWNYVKMEQFELAEKDFRVAIEFAPEDAEAHTLLGYLMALQGKETAADLSAVTGVLYGGQDPLVLHNVACVFAQLARAKDGKQDEYENAALSVLARAIKLSMQNPNGINLIEVIRNEPAFELLKERTEFQKLVE